MNAHRPPFFHWPGWKQFGYAVRLGLAQAVLFTAVYGGADWWTEQHERRVAVHTSFDLALPLVPWMALVYVSLTPLLWLAIFVLRTRAQLQAIVLAQAVATLIAGVGFILVPAEAAYPIPSEVALGIWADLFHFARWMTLRHNYLPSLHVAFTTICVGVYLPHARGLGKILLWGWGGAIVASTLLTHQHYLLDVVTGGLLGGGAAWWVYRPWAQRSAAIENIPASRSTDPMPPV